MLKKNLYPIGRAGLVLAGLLAFGCSQEHTATLKEPAASRTLRLFNGRDFGGWKAMKPAQNAWQTAAKVALDPAHDARFQIIPGAGILVNGPEGKTTNIYTLLEHGDCEAHIEFMVPKGSNSGVYFQGRYEVQVFDSFGVTDLKYSDCGGIYARHINNVDIEGHAPRVNATRQPGEWQTFDVKFTAPRFDADGKKTANARFDWVKLNGTLIQENIEVTGPTRAAMDENTEVARGPLMLQGDHGPVAYRNLRVHPLN